MKAEFYKVRGTELEEALENVEFYKSIGNMEFASNEQNRANLLQRQLEMLNK